ncbi:MAG: hypothetical protein JXA30_15450 [Deltaproteobacteria bacterium]|nr:hypothetical protein [Deltaproteobacteria bacterium]
MQYIGPERRIHRIFITRNSEYHMKRAICVAIRDRKSGQWCNNHSALRQEIAGSILFDDDGSIQISPGFPRVGESMYFDIGGVDLITSSIVSVERPIGDVLAQYVT